MNRKASTMTMHIIYTYAYLYTVSRFIGHTRNGLACIVPRKRACVCRVDSITGSRGCVANSQLGLHSKSICCTRNVYVSRVCGYVCVWTLDGPNPAEQVSPVERDCFATHITNIHYYQSTLERSCFNYRQAVDSSLSLSFWLYICVEHTRRCDYRALVLHLLALVVRALITIRHGTNEFYRLL